MSTIMVRVDRKAHADLKDLANAMNRPMQDVLGDAIEQYRRAQVLKQTSRAYAKLRKNPAAWREEQKLRAELDGTLLDGLENT